MVHWRRRRSSGAGAREGVKNLVSLLRESRMMVRIVCGNLDARIYEDPRFLRAVTSAMAERKLWISILTGPEFDSNLAERLRRLGCSVESLPERPELHFAVGDLDKVRFEGLHEEGAPIPLNSASNSAPRTAQYLASAFDELLEGVSSCTGNVRRAEGD